MHPNALSEWFRKDHVADRRVNPSFLTLGNSYIDFIDRASVFPHLQLMCLENVGLKGHPRLLGPSAPGFNNLWVQIITNAQTTKALCSGLQRPKCPATPPQHL